MIAFVAIKL